MDWPATLTLVALCWVGMALVEHLTDRGDG